MVHVNKYFGLTLFFSSVVMAGFLCNTSRAKSHSYLHNTDRMRSFLYYFMDKEKTFLYGSPEYRRIQKFKEEFLKNPFIIKGNLQEHINYKKRLHERDLFLAKKQWEAIGRLEKTNL